MRNLSYENDFCMQFHFHANQSHFRKNGSALRLALKQRHKGTRKWPICDDRLKKTTFEDKTMNSEDCQNPPQMFECNFFQKSSTLSNVAVCKRFPVNFLA